jgi:hypothetical protein
MTDTMSSKILTFPPGTICIYGWKGGRKKKAMSVTGPHGPWGCEKLRLPHYLANQLTGGGEVVSHMRRPPFALRKIPDTHIC